MSRHNLSCQKFFMSQRPRKAGDSVQRLAIWPFVSTRSAGLSDLVRFPVESPDRDTANMPVECAYVKPFPDNGHRDQRSHHSRLFAEVRGGFAEAISLSAQSSRSAVHSPWTVPRRFHLFTKHFLKSSPVFLNPSSPIKTRQHILRDKHQKWVYPD